MADFIQSRLKKFPFRKGKVNDKVNDIPLPLGGKIDEKKFDFPKTKLGGLGELVRTKTFCKKTKKKKMRRYSLSEKMDGVWLIK